MCDHETEEILRKKYPMEPDEVVLWCNKCGAIQVAAECDGRYISEYTRPVRYPKCSRPKASP